MSLPAFTPMPFLSCGVLSNTPAWGPYSLTVRDQNPIHYYRLQDDHTTTCQDVVGGANGTYENGAILSEQGALISEPNAACAGFGIYDDDPFQQCINLPDDI